MGKENLAAVHPYILESYYADNARKLHRMVDRLLSRFGGLSDKDTDDFYSLANEVFVDVMGRYDPGQPFDGFLYTCLSNKIRTEMTRRNREKRRADRMCVSLDAVGEDGEEYSLLDLIPSGSDTFEEAVEGIEGWQYHDRVQIYISRLSNRQVSILNLLIDGYKPCEIRRMLGIPSGEYAADVQTMRSYENVKVLF